MPDIRQASGHPFFSPLQRQINSVLSGFNPANLLYVQEVLLQFYIVTYYIKKGQDFLDIQYILTLRSCLKNIRLLWLNINVHNKRLEKNQLKHFTNYPGLLSNWATKSSIIIGKTMVNFIIHYYIGFVRISWKKAKIATSIIRLFP